MLETQEHAAKPPLVKGAPVIGSLVPLLRDPLTFFRRTYEKSGEIYTFRAGHLEFVVMGGAEANRFLSENGKDCLVSEEFWGAALEELECPHQFVGVDGEMHRYQRSLLMPYFMKSKFIGNLPSFAEIFEQTFSTHYGKSALVGPLLRHVLAQQIGITMQGYRPTSAEVESLIYWENTALRACSTKQAPRFVLKLPKYRSAKRQMRALADKILALQAQGDKRTYLDEVLSKGKKTRPEWFTDGDVRAHAVIPFIAGTDTVGAELAFAVRELFLQPELRQRLQDEVDEVFGKGIPDVATLDSMVNLRNFCKEVLRLYPTAYVLRRNATRDFTFKGHLVRKGQTVIVFNTADHTNAAYFKDPYRFDIDRYNPPRSERPPSGALAPFGMGAHTCMGAGLANVLMPLNVALLLHYADVKPVNDITTIKPTTATAGLTLDKRFAMYVEPRQRARVERRQSPAKAANGAGIQEAVPSPNGVPHQAAMGCPVHKPAQNRDAVRIVMSPDRCQGHGKCMALAPELFCVGGDGKIESFVEVAEGALAEKARAAAAACPAGAIRVASLNEA